MVHEVLAPGEVVQVLHGGAVGVGYPTAAAEVVRVIEIERRGGVLPVGKRVQIGECPAIWLSQGGGIIHITCHRLQLLLHEGITHHGSADIRKLFLSYL